jgi:hypothetical protein
MATIDQISRTAKANRGLQDSTPYRRVGRTIVNTGRLDETHDAALGDYAEGQRTHPDHRLVSGDFATGLRTVAKLAAAGDFATGLRRACTAARTGDFATGLRTDAVDLLFRYSGVSSLRLAA